MKPLHLTSSANPHFGRTPTYLPPTAGMVNSGGRTYCICDHGSGGVAAYPRLSICSPQSCNKPDPRAGTAARKRPNQ